MPGERARFPSVVQGEVNVCLVCVYRGHDVIPPEVTRADVVSEDNNGSACHGSGLPCEVVMGQGLAHEGECHAKRERDSD